MKTAVLQSHRPDRLNGWMGDCTKSVQSWAAQWGFSYFLIGDALFDFSPGWVVDKTGDQTVIASDVARLAWMQTVLDDGFDRVIWCDADLLVFAPAAFEVHAVSHAFGREVWVQRNGGTLKAYRKVHNAFMMFGKESPVLPFYYETVLRLLDRADMPVVPQFAGPKLLTALHNISGFHVDERAGMLSPLAIADLLAGGGNSLDMTHAGHTAELCAVNLSASYEGRATDGVALSEEDYARAIAALMDAGQLPPSDSVLREA